MVQSNHVPKPAHILWGGLALYVVLADTYLIYMSSKDNVKYYTLSSAFRDALRHPIKRWPVIVLWALLTFHLFDFFFPEKVQRLEPAHVATAVAVRFTKHRRALQRTA